MIKEILFAYGWNDETKIIPFGNGLINKTWKVKNGNDIYILQKINNNIFKSPLFISENINALANYLFIKHPGYFF